MPDPRQLHRTSTRLLAIVMLAIGVALIVETFVTGMRGGIPVGLVLGVLFVAAGAARLYLHARQGRGS